MYKYLEYLNNPIIAGLFAAFLVISFAYIDKWINDRDFTYKYYIRLFIVVSLTVSIIVYITNSRSKYHLGGGGGSFEDITGGAEKNVKTIVKKLGGGGSGIDVYSDVPDF